MAQKTKTLTVQITLEKATGNFWIDNGLVALYRRLGEGDFSVEEVLQKLVQELAQPTGNQGEYFDPQTRTLRTYEKKNWVYPSNLFIKATPKAEKIRYEGRDYFTAPPEYNLKLTFGREGACDVCGAAQPLTDAKMWMFPFAVDPGKFGNFYPGVKRGMKLCPRCALAGLAGYLAWLWRAQGRDALHIFLFHTDLRALDRLHRTVLRPLQAKTQAGGGNVPLPFWGPYLHESTLALLLELFSHVDRSNLLSDEGRRLLAEFLGAGPAPPPAPLRLYTVTGTPGQAFNMTGFREFSRFHELYRLYRAWKNLFQVDNPHVLLVQVFRQFQTRQNRQYETLWRDRIAWSILEFQDPFPFVEDFLFDARAREKNPGPLSFGTLDVFGLYAKEVLKMEEQLLKTLAGFGHTLGRTAHDKNEMGLLYALRNAKNADEFFKVLNDVQFRLELTVPEVLLAIEPGERIKGSPWKRVKTLLSIYAMNAYLLASRGQAQEKKEGESHE